MTSRALSLSLISIVASGCIISTGDDEDCTGGKCDADDVCTDPQYGDGVCQTQLDCAVPDIDCFETFDTDADAAVWFTAFENQLAMEEGREPRRLLDETHPRWAKTRQLLDDGWEAFKTSRPVGELRAKRPGLVLIEDATPNAFVAPDLTTGNAGFAVMVLTGLFETGGTDDGALGVMMHEFQHAVGLHVVADVKQRVRKFYVAGDGPEPIGKDQPDDPRARMYGEAWRAAADEIGVLTDAELGGLPLGGQIDQVFQAALAQSGQMEVASCQTAREAYNALRGAILESVDLITGLPSFDRTTMPGRVQQALDGLRTGCFASFTSDFITVVATMAGTTPETIEMAMTAEDKALVKDKPIVDGVAALSTDRRTKMRALMDDFAAQTNRPWTALRYFSFEEDADDVSVPVLRGANVEAGALGPFLVSLLPDEPQARCETILASYEVPAYGADLHDEHHSVCWRGYHVRQLAESTERRATRPQMFDVQVQSRLPVPRPLRDRLAF